MNKLIFIAEDNFQLLTALESILQTQGYRVESVTDGLRAPQRVRECKPDLVLLDMQLPGAFGSEVFKKLRADAATAHIPVIFMSGLYTEDMLKQRIPEEPSVRYMSKPLDMPLLLGSIAELLGQAPPPKADGKP